MNLDEQNKILFTPATPSLCPIQSCIHSAPKLGYATYMNIQFCLFHRLDHLKLSPRYTTDLMGVAVQVKFLADGVALKPNYKICNSTSFR